MEVFKKLYVTTFFDKNKSLIKMVIINLLIRNKLIETKIYF
jgi:hypothetical protein